MILTPVPPHKKSSSFSLKIQTIIKYKVWPNEGKKHNFFIPEMNWSQSYYMVFMFNLFLWRKKKTLNLHKLKNFALLKLDFTSLMIFFIPSMTSLLKTSVIELKYKMINLKTDREISNKPQILKMSMIWFIRNENVHNKYFTVQ